MRAAGAGPLQLVLRATKGERGEPEPAALARRAIHPMSVLRGAAYDGLVAHPGLPGQSQAGRPADAGTWHHRDLSRTTLERPRRGPPDLSVLAPGRRGGASGP